MDMTLTIDCGNSFVKAALFNGSDPFEAVVMPHDDLSSLKALIGRQLHERVVVSAVRELPALDDLLASCPQPVLRLGADTPVPLSIDYGTRETLGGDRIATAVGAHKMAQDHHIGGDLLVVDAGTAVTIDLVTEDGHFAGGNISAGLTMRLRALHEHTGRLPLLQHNDLGDTLPPLGCDTRSALACGAVRGLAAEIEGTAHHLARTVTKRLPMVVLTGGDHPLLAHYLTIPVMVLPDLLLQGLYLISQYNSTIDQ